MTSNHSYVRLLASLSLLATASACPGDDAVGATGLTGSSTGTSGGVDGPDGGPGDGVDSTGPGGADSTGPGGSDSGTAGLDGSSSGDTMGLESSSGGTLCGDDVIEGAEVCDNGQLSGEDCVSQGFDDGTLACADDCTDYDTTACVMYECGDDTVQDRETCDGVDLAGEDCISQGFDGGELACDPTCKTFDTVNCISFVCGDNIINADDVCDGTDLDGEDCISQGFGEGTLGCTADCTAYDTSGCGACGDGVINGGELCDDTDFGGDTCVAQGFLGGLLACAAACDAVDTTGCCAVAVGDSDIGETVGVAVGTGANFGANNDLQPSCAAAEGEELSYLWTAPATQTYTIDTEGSDFDTVLYVTDVCGANELACDDDDGTTTLSSLTLDAVEGEQYLIAVDGWNNDTGNIVLNISVSLAACVDGAALVGTGTPLVSGDNTGALDDYAPACGAAGSEDVTYEWIAPTTGLYQFDTINSALDTVLAVAEGCGASEIACDDDGGGAGPSLVLLPVTAGVPYLVAVDAFDGATGLFDLNINPFIDTCNDADTGAATGTVAIGTNVGATDDTQPSCGVTPGEEFTYQWTAPADGDYVFDTFGSDLDTILYVLDGCGGTELACNDQAGGGNASQVTVTATAGATYSVVVDAWNNNTGNIVLSINSAADACVEANTNQLGAPVATGANAGAGDDYQPTCVATPGEEVIHQWVAPASGTYTVDTFGSDYNTVLEILDGCGGASLGCNDQAGGTDQSELEFDAVLGTTYLFAVDADLNSAGNYLLNINGPY